MKKILVALLLIVLSFGVQAQNSRLAIIPFTGGDTGEGDTIARLIGNELTKAGGFSIVPRTAAIAQVLNEQKFQRSGLTDADTIVEIGKGANAEYVVTGHISKLGSKSLVVVSMTEVETFHQTAGAYETYNDLGEMRGKLATIATTLTKNTLRSITKKTPTLALAPFDIVASSGASEKDAEVLAQILACEIANSAVYSVVLRTSTIERVLEEQNIQRSGLTTSEGIQKIGAALNAEYVLAGFVSKLGSTTLMDTQIIKTVNQVQESGASVEYSTIEDGTDIMRGLSYDLLGVVLEDIQSPTIGRLKAIQGGSFDMGSESGLYDEMPVRHVSVGNFLLAETEVTQGQWEAVMGSWPEDDPESSYGKGNNHPAYNVNWLDAVAFCNELSRKEGLTPFYSISGDTVTVKDWSVNGYRLPTEAEWEYAAGGGATNRTTYAGTDSESSLGSYAWYDYNSSKTHAVKGKRANALGLYDMSGNVYEWCWDWYDYYDSEDTDNPTGPRSNTNRVLRGGSWYFSANLCRVADRNYGIARSYRESLIGFRVARSP